MNTPSKQFVDKAMCAVDALRVFAHNLQLDETTFKSETSGARGSFQEVISFRSTQCWGSVTRTATNLSIKVIPRTGIADDFVARTLVFPARFYDASMMFTTPTSEFLDQSGKTFCTAFAGLFTKLHSPNRFQAIPYSNGGDRLIMIGERSKDDLEHSQDIDLMASGLRAILNDNKETSHSDMAIFIQHPAFDLSGTAKLIDGADRIHAVGGGMFGERFSQINEGTKYLLPALMFDNISDEYPVSFEVAPLRFTIAAPQDPDRAKTLGMMAAQRIEVRARIRSGAADRDIDTDGPHPNF